MHVLADALGVVLEEQRDALLWGYSFCWFERPKR
jgi:hypothetical protein